MPRAKQREDFLSTFFPPELRELAPTRHLRLDAFEREILHNMHIELQRGDSYLLLSPGLMILRPSDAKDVEESLKGEEEFLTQLKRYVMQDLLYNSCVLEGNSYFIEQNYHLTIIRFIPAGPGTYELKIYTNTRVDLISHYSDKIYIGREIVSLVDEKRQFGLPYLLSCIKREYERLRLDARDRLRNPRRYQSTLMNEIGELVGEIMSESEEYLRLMPSSPSSANSGGDELDHINSQNRSMKHLMIELADSISEYESLLRTHHENEYARYLTKFKKDTVNLINLYNIRIIPAFSRRVS